MFRVKIIVAVAIATGLFGYALVTLRASTERDPGQGSASPEQSVTRATKGRGQQVRSSDAELDHNMTRRRWEAMLASPAGVEPSSSPTIGDSRAGTLVQATEAQLALDFYTRSHAQQPRDASWSREQEEQLSDLLGSGAFAGTTLEEVDCRTSQCRIVVMHQDNEARQDLRRAWGQGPFRHGSYSHFDEETRFTTIYLGREGYEFQYPSLGASPDEGNASSELAER